MRQAPGPGSPIGDGRALAAARRPGQDQRHSARPRPRDPPCPARKCPECGFVAPIPAGRAAAKNFCLQCDARLPRPTRGSSPLIVVGIVGAALALLCLVPAGLLFAWLGLRDRPAPGPVAAADPAPVRPVGVAQPDIIPPKVADAPLPADGSLPPDVLDKLKAATVFVKVVTPRGVSSGSGFVLRKDAGDAYIVTNHHVVEDRQARAGRPWRIVRSCSTAAGGPSSPCRPPSWRPTTTATWPSSG